MTYDEAVSMRDAIGKSYLHNGETFIPRITPNKESDDINFISNLKNHHISEEEMKSFSTDGMFKVRGFMKKSYHYL